MTSADDAGIDPHLLLGGFSSSLWIPRYRAGTWGPWTLSVILMTGARGYWGKTYGMAGTTILTGPSEGSDASWMSIVPAEIESQEIGIAAAYGHTAVLGMGMGWCAANVALNPAVERVTVVERDPHIIELIDTLGILDQLPSEARAKITVVQDDALAWRPDGRVDSVQADIWAKFVEPRKWADVHRIQANTGAESLYFWGQEMELYRLACRELGHEPDRLDRETITRLADSTGLPLVHPDWPDYADRIVAAVPWWTPQDGKWWRTE